MAPIPSRNLNHILTGTWSNPDSETAYRALWPGEPNTAASYRAGLQCHDCRHFAAFDADWGLCCNSGSRHFTETVFEHFTCPWFHSLPAKEPRAPGHRPKPYGHR
jgi:hypothetical protein